MATRGLKDRPDKASNLWQSETHYVTYVRPLKKAAEKVSFSFWFVQRPAQGLQRSAFFQLSQFMALFYPDPRS